MRIPGYCERCHKVKPVRASGNAFALAHARGGVVTGICATCEDEQDAERKARSARLR